MFRFSSSTAGVFYATVALVAFTLTGIAYESWASNSYDATPYTRSQKQSMPGDIIDVAVGPGMQTVTTLVTAIQAAELVDALKGDGPFTVFAPTNDAFAKLPEGVVADLLKPENKSKLQSILLYHVHAGETITSDDLRSGKLSTLNGKKVKIDIDGPTVTINNATITKTDVMASNGVIHWVDTVILP